MQDDSPCCYICLGATEAGPLVQPCGCKAHHVHRACLSRWQLQQAGRPEEVACR